VTSISPCVRISTRCNPTDNSFSLRGELQEEVVVKVPTEEGGARHLRDTEVEVRDDTWRAANRSAWQRWILCRQWTLCNIIGWESFCQGYKSVLQLQVEYQRRSRPRSTYSVHTAEAAPGVGQDKRGNGPTRRHDKKAPVARRWS
jgi:hypothetical protein